MMSINFKNGLSGQNGLKENAISATLKTLGQNGSSKLQRTLR
jgi:hypothetical protein